MAHQLTIALLHLLCRGDATPMHVEIISHAIRAKLWSLWEDETYKPQVALLSAACVQDHLPMQSRHQAIYTGPNKYLA